MFRKLLPQTVDFFEFFEGHCALTVEAAKKLFAMAEPGADLAALTKEIKDFEHQADSLTHRCITAMQKTFITPFDRADMHRLIRRLDDIMDSVNDSASRMVIYELKEIRPEAREFAQVIHQASLSLSDALKLMRNLKNEKAIQENCIKVHGLENNGDEILRAALRRLFKENTDPLEVIKWKEIFEHLEKATDRCEDVADIIQSVILEAS